MLKTGLVGNPDDTLFKVVLNHPGFKVTGCFYPFASGNELNTRYKTKVPLLTAKTLLGGNDVIIFQEAGTELIELITAALKKSKHIMLLDSGKLTAGAIAGFIKLREEAQSVVNVWLPARSNPVLQACRPLITQPSLVDIRILGQMEEERGRPESPGEAILRMTDALLFVSPPNIKRIQSLQQPVNSQDFTFINARIEFDNGSVANILAADMAETESFKIDIYQKDQIIKVDMNDRRLIVLTKSGRPAEKNIRKLEFSDPGTRPFFSELENFHTSVVTGNASGKSLFEMFRVAELSLKINEKAGFS